MDQKDPYAVPGPSQEGAPAVPGLAAGPQGGAGPYAGPVTETAPRRRGRTPYVLAGATALALALGGGGYVAANQLGLLGAGGATPDSVIPASAVGYVRFDSNPDLGQKVAVFRLADKLPQAKEALERDKDWRKAVFDEIKKDDADLKDVDFDRDVKPWLGDRAASAIYSPGEGQEVVPMVALAVKDEAKAREGMKKLGLKEDDTDLRFKDGYALLTEKGKGDQTVAAIEKGTLKGQEQFTSDMKDLGSDGVASMWLDLSRLAKTDLTALGDSASSATSGAASGDMEAAKEQLGKAGRVAAALRFDASYVELAGIQRGGQQPAEQVPQERVDLGALPADTLGAYGFGDGEKLIKAMWPTFVQQMDESAGAGSSEKPSEQLTQGAEALGLSLPDDLAVLFGKQAAFVVADQDFSQVSESNLPKVGFRSVTDAAKAEAVVQKVVDAVAQQQGASASSFPVKAKADGEVFTLAMDDSYRSTLAGSGTLGESEGFKLAMKDARPTAGLYVDLDRLEKAYLDQVPEDQKEFVKAMRGIGMVSTVEGPGRGDFSLRLVAN